jgi:NADPH-dependent glutamate synthase beta subunit-like oxidoreductase
LATSKTISSKKMLEKLLDAEKLKYCFECGICTASCSMAEMLSDKYNPRTILEKVLLDPDSVLASDELWLCAWCYRCYKRCPQALKLPEIFLSLRSAAVEQGYVKPFERALQRIVKDVPLPLVATLVCFHPERSGVNKKQALEKIEQLRQQRLKSAKGHRATESRKERIAVVGSGPAGLTVAYELARKGYGITIFDSLPELGGMLRKGIPEHRLPKRILAKEIQFIKKLGVNSRTNTKVGKDITFDDLRKEVSDVIFVGAGAQKGQRLRIKGEELKGVTHALDFLWDSNFDKKMKTGKKVVVIGGGKSAVDAATTALHLGASQVTILYRRSREEMPASLWEVKEAEDQGVQIELLASPKRILGENGKVSAIECLRMELGEPDETGRKKAHPIEGTEFKIETDMVILAIGEVPDLDFLPRRIERNENGTIWVDPVTMETSMPGVFAGGDAVTGPASVIEAIRDGKRAAESIERHFEALRETQNV